MEFFVMKDHSVAFKIYELGMKPFSSEPLFIFSYMKLLLLDMDDINAKGLFERALKSITDKKSLYILWNLFIEHERNYGYLPFLSELCRRKMDSFPECKHQRFTTT